MKSKYLFIILIAATLFGCSVKLVPTYDPAIVSQVGAATNLTNDLYSKMLNSTNKEYTTYRSEYDFTSQSIDNIVALESQRSNNKVVLKIANDIKIRFANYIKEHIQAGTLNDAQISSYRNGMNALWTALYNTESHYKH